MGLFRAASTCSPASSFLSLRSAARRSRKQSLKPAALRHVYVKRLNPLNVVERLFIPPSGHLGGYHFDVGPGFGIKPLVFRRSFGFENGSSAGVVTAEEKTQAVFDRFMFGPGILQFSIVEDARRNIPARVHDLADLGILTLNLLEG